MTTSKKATPSQLWLERIYDSGLSGHHKSIAAYLASIMFGNKTSCFQSATTITKNVGWSERKVRDCLNDLIEQKWLVVEGLHRSGTRILAASTPAQCATPAPLAPAPPAPLHPVLATPAPCATESVTESVRNIYRFKPPSVEEVKAYCREKNYTIDPETFVDWNSSKGWMIGKNKMKDWKAAVRTWQKRENQNGQSRKGRQAGNSHSQRGPKVTTFADIFGEGNDIVG